MTELNTYLSFEHERLLSFAPTTGGNDGRVAYFTAHIGRPPDLLHLSDGEAMEAVRIHLLQPGLASRTIMLTW